MTSPPSPEQQRAERLREAVRLLELALEACHRLLREAERAAGLRPANDEHEPRRQR